MVVGSRLGHETCEDELDDAEAFMEEKLEIWKMIFGLMMVLDGQVYQLQTSDLELKSVCLYC